MLQYAFSEGTLLTPLLMEHFHFSLRRVACLLGDLPNASMRRRFLNSEAGRTFHRSYTGSRGRPISLFGHNYRWANSDDGIIFGLCGACTRRWFPCMECSSSARRTCLHGPIGAKRSTLRTAMNEYQPRELIVVGDSLFCRRSPTSTLNPTRHTTSRHLVSMNVSTRKRHPIPRLAR